MIDEARVAKAMERVYIVLTAQIKPGKTDEALAYVMAEAEHFTLEEHGIRLVDMYVVQVGRGGELVDVWEAESYDGLDKAFFSHRLEVITAEEGELFDSMDLRIARRYYHV